jgi:DNA-binding CsgD family transcriptional regulator
LCSRDCRISDVSHTSQRFVRASPDHSPPPSRLRLIRTGRSLVALHPRDEEIVRLRRDGKTLQQIADAHGMSRQRVNQILLNRLGAEGSATILREIRTARKQQLQNEAVRARSARRAARRAGQRVPLSTRKWPSAELLKILVEASTMAFPLTVSAFEQLRRNHLVKGPTAQTFSNRFGNWSKACASAGVESGARKRRFGSQWSDREVVEFVRHFFAGENGESFSAYDAWAKLNGGPSSGTVAARFGSWSNAKRRAAQDVAGSTS